MFSNSGVSVDVRAAERILAREFKLGGTYVRHPIRKLIFIANSRSPNFEHDRGGGTKMSVPYCAWWDVDRRPLSSQKSDPGHTVERCDF